SIAALEQFLVLANRPTAILAANNFIAIGFVRAVRQRGMDIPTHFALACFEKIEPMDLVKPTVTTAIQPAYNFATIATQLLLERVEGLPVEAPRRIILRPEIVIGESTDGFNQKTLVR